MGGGVDYRVLATSWCALRARAPRGTYSPACREYGNETHLTPGAAPGCNTPVMAAGALHADGNNARGAPCPIRPAVAGESPPTSRHQGRCHSAMHQSLRSSPGSQRFPPRKTRAYCETKILNRSPAGYLHLVIAMPRQAECVVPHRAMKAATIGCRGYPRRGT